MALAAQFSLVLVFVGVTLAFAAFTGATVLVGGKISVQTSDE
jgi:putative Ca2+/H+ antiporter (TMEM165/GDT1 family)